MSSIGAFPQTGSETSMQDNVSAQTGNAPTTVAGANKVSARAAQAEGDNLSSTLPSHSQDQSISSSTGLGRTAGDERYNDHSGGYPEQERQGGRADEFGSEHREKGRIGDNITTAPSEYKNIPSTATAPGAARGNDIYDHSGEYDHEQQRQGGRHAGLGSEHRKEGRIADNVTATPSEYNNNNNPIGSAHNNTSRTSAAEQGNQNIPSLRGSAPAPASNIDTDQPGNYPDQKHAGRVEGYGPEHAKEGGIGDKVTGIKEQLKGKVTKNPDLVQTGKDRYSGTLAEKERQVADSEDPFNKGA